MTLGWVSFSFAASWAKLPTAPTTRSTGRRCRQRTLPALKLRSKLTCCEPLTASMVRRFFRKGIAAGIAARSSSMKASIAALVNGSCRTLSRNADPSTAQGNRKVVPSTSTGERARWIRSRSAAISSTIQCSPFENSSGRSVNWYTAVSPPNAAVVPGRLRFSPLAIFRKLRKSRRCFRDPSHSHSADVTSEQRSKMPSFHTSSASSVTTNRMPSPPARRPRSGSARRSPCASPGGRRAFARCCRGDPSPGEALELRHLPA